ncbi:GNAT family N-acetyltransferase [Mycoplasma sp. P36-A1]|uniref:GNAT family N-acetyltransferase n=1 Tax=Mycoplasma sp. P36-A1 TaxID=3252900 RepID=UPI003C30990E
MSNLNITLLESPTELDIQQIFQVWEKDVKHVRDFLNENQFKMDQGLFAREFKASKVYVARNDTNEIKGFILLNKQRILGLYVLPKLQKQGIQEELAKHVLVNDEANMVLVEETDEPFYNFYSNLGFRPIEKSKVNEYGLLIPTIKMIRD